MDVRWTKTVAFTYHQYVMHRSRTPADAAQALADPIRFAVLVRLLEGPATVADLAAVTGASQPNVSNHLALLRDRGLVRARREGRHARYDIADPAVAQAVEALVSLSGPDTSAPRPPAPLAVARTCYDHLAGVLGVALLDGLVEAGVVSRPERSSGTIRLGPVAERTFGLLGVDAERALRARRKFAYGCPDWTERRPHLGGSLGAALCERFFEEGWIRRARGSRAVTLTADGARTLRRVLGIPADRLERTRPPRTAAAG